MRILIGGRSYPRKKNDKDKELMVKNTIVRGQNVNARYKCRMHMKQQKTIIYEQKQLKNLSHGRKDIVLVLKVMNYREKPT